MASLCIAPLRVKKKSAVIQQVKVYTAIQIIQTFVYMIYSQRHCIYTIYLHINILIYNYILT